mmetsp:Transcript_15396/g.33373  ORF Transcript_15396/g.33373 Transcript_15396/m.33373 type:complete len:101 (+) Transcript_15396:164-466(+)
MDDTANTNTHIGGTCMLHMTWEHGRMTDLPLVYETQHTTLMLVCTFLAVPWHISCMYGDFACLLFAADTALAADNAAEAAAAGLFPSSPCDMNCYWEKSR